MKALVFAAGRGERLRPLTDTIPKPLVEVGGRTLLARHLVSLERAGFEQIIINCSHLSEKIELFIEESDLPTLEIVLSREPDGPLETGGGMRRALPLLGSEPVLAINADILCDVDLAALQAHRLAGLAHLVLVPNPSWKRGDFGLEDSRITGRDAAGHTFAGIGIYHPDLVANEPDGKFSIVPLLERAMAAGEVTSQLHEGLWLDIGTPERLAEARELYHSSI